MDYIDLIVHTYVVLMLFIAYLSLRRASRAKSHRKREESLDVKEFVTPSPQLTQVLNNVERANEISDNSLELLVNVKNQQQNLKTDIERSLKSIEKSTQRFDHILGNPQSKGALGEYLIEERLALLPLDWITRDVEFSNGRKVEFALRAPNGLLIPIDSKWAATELLDRLAQTTDKNEQDALIKRIRDAVSERAQEVYRYLDKHRTIGFGIAVVPDAVLPYCLDAQARLLKANVVLISYSLLIPYILIIFNLFLSSAQGIQALQVSQILKRSLLQIEQLQEEIDTNVRPPLDTVRLQQSQYLEHNQKLEAVSALLKQIQDSLPPTISTVPHKDVESIPNVLQYHLERIREGLADGLARQNGHDASESTQSPMS